MNYSGWEAGSDSLELRVPWILCSRRERREWVESESGRGGDLAFTESLDCSLTESVAEAEMWAWRIANGAGNLQEGGEGGRPNPDRSPIRFATSPRFAP